MKTCPVTHLECANSGCSVTDCLLSSSAPNSFTIGDTNAYTFMGKGLWVRGTMNAENAPDRLTSIGAVTMTITGPQRTENSSPAAYRLAKKPDGTLVLQGAYMWQEGFTTYGHEWRDIPTVDLDKEDA